MVNVSVIVPVYNNEKYLRQCLTSILNQNLEKIEIICVNDGSTDNSLKILNEYKEKDNRIKVIEKNNGGLSSARNVGIKIAQGQYIIHIDSDDWIEENYLGDVYELAIKDNLDMVITDYYEEYENGEIIYKYNDYVGANTNLEYIEKIFLGDVAPAVWNKLIKSELYKQNNILHPENIALGEDLATIPRLIFFCKKIKKIDKAYVHYMQNPKSITKNTTLKNLYNLKETFNILEDFFISKKIKLPFPILKIKHYSYKILNCPYSNKIEYRNLIQDYLESIKKCNLENIKSRKLKLYCHILKKNNNLKAFYMIYHFNKFMSILKKLIKNIL